MPQDQNYISLNDDNSIFAPEDTYSTPTMQEMSNLGISASDTDIASGKAYDSETGINQIRRDYANLSSEDFDAKYGEKASQYRAQINLNKLAYQNERDAYNKLGLDTVRDTAVGVGAGLIDLAGTVVRMANLPPEVAVEAVTGTSAVQQDARLGKLFNNASESFRKALGSDAMQRRRELAERQSKANNQFLDEVYKREVQEEGEAVATLRRAGRDILNSVGNMQSGELAENAAGLVATGMGFGALGKGALKLSSKVVGAKLAQAVEKGMGKYGVGGLLAEASMQRAAAVDALADTPISQFYEKADGFAEAVAERMANGETQEEAEVHEKDLRIKKASAVTASIAGLAGALGGRTTERVLKGSNAGLLGNFVKDPLVQSGIGVAETGSLNLGKKLYADRDTNLAQDIGETVKAYATGTLALHGARGALKGVGIGAKAVSDAKGKSKGFVETMYEDGIPDTTLKNDLPTREVRLTEANNQEIEKHMQALNNSDQYKNADESWKKMRAVDLAKANAKTEADFKNLDDYSNVLNAQAEQKLGALASPKSDVFTSLDSKEGKTLDALSEEDINNSGYSDKVKRAMIGAKSIRTKLLKLNQNTEGKQRVLDEMLNTSVGKQFGIDAVTGERRNKHSLKDSINLVLTELRSNKPNTQVINNELKHLAQFAEGQQRKIHAYDQSAKNNGAPTHYDMYTGLDTTLNTGDKNSKQAPVTYKAFTNAEAYDPARDQIANLVMSGQAITAVRDGLIKAVEGIEGVEIPENLVKMNYKKDAPYSYQFRQAGMKAWKAKHQNASRIDSEAPRTQEMGQGNTNIAPKAEEASQTQSVSNLEPIAEQSSTPITKEENKPVSTGFTSPVTTKANAPQQGTLDLGTKPVPQADKREGDASVIRDKNDDINSQLDPTNHNYVSNAQIDEAVKTSKSNKASIASKNASQEPLDARITHENEQGSTNTREEATEAHRTQIEASSEHSENTSEPSIDSIEEELANTQKTDTSSTKQASEEEINKALDESQNTADLSAEDIIDYGFDEEVVKAKLAKKQAPVEDIEVKKGTKQTVTEEVEQEKELDTEPVIDEHIVDNKNWIDSSISTALKFGKSVFPSAGKSIAQGITKVIKTSKLVSPSVKVTFNDFANKEAKTVQDTMVNFLRKQIVTKVFNQKAFKAYQEEVANLLTSESIEDQEKGRQLLKEKLLQFPNRRLLSFFDIDWNKLKTAKTEAEYMEAISMNPALAEALAMTSVQTLGEASLRNSLDEESLAESFGITAEQLANQGVVITNLVSKNNFANDLYSNLKHNLGISFNKQSEIQFTMGTLSSLASDLMQAMKETGLLHEQVIVTNKDINDESVFDLGIDPASTYDNPKQMQSLEATAKKFDPKSEKINTQRIYLMDSKTKGRYADVSKAINAGTAQEDKLTSIVGEGVNEEGKTVLDHTPSKILHTQNNLSQEQRENIRHAQHREYRVVPFIRDLIMKMGQDVCTVLVGNLEAEDPNYNGFKSTKIRETGRNQDVRAAFSAMQEQEDQRKQINPKDPDSVPVHWLYDITTVGRYQQRGVSPQGNKLMRIMMSTNTSVLNLNDQNSLDFKAFILALGQALDMKIQDMTFEQIRDAVQSKIFNEDGQFHTLALRLAKGEVTNVKDAHLVRKQLQDAGIKPADTWHFIHGMMEAGKYMTLLKIGEEVKADLDHFKSSLMIELDGVTNGPAGIQIMLPLDLFNENYLQNAARVGVSFGQETKSKLDLNSEVDKTKGKDIYTYIANVLGEHLEELYASNTHDNDKKKVDEFLDALFELETLFNGAPVSGSKEGTTYKFARSFTKKPVTKQGYGAGDKALGQSSVVDLMSMVKALGDMLKRNNVQTLDEAEKVAPNIVRIINKLQKLFTDYEVWAITKKTGREIRSNRGPIVEASAKPFTSTLGAIKNLQDEKFINTVLFKRVGFNRVGKVLGVAMTQAVRRVTGEKTNQGLQALSFTSTILAGIAQIKATSIIQEMQSKGNKMTQEEYENYQKQLNALGYTIKTRTHTLNMTGMIQGNLAKSDNSVDLTLGKALTTNEGFTAKQIGIGMPTALGAGAMPNTVISFGDGSMMAEVIKEDDVLDMYDGIGVRPVDAIANEGVGYRINKAMLNAWRQNPYAKVANLFDKVLAELTKEERAQLDLALDGAIDNADPRTRNKKSVQSKKNESIGLDFTSDLKASFDLLYSKNANNLDESATGADFINYIQNTLRNNANEVEANHIVQNFVGISSDQMAGVNRPFKLGKGVSFEGIDKVKTLIALQETAQALVNKGVDRKEIYKALQEQFNQLKNSLGTQQDVVIQTEIAPVDIKTEEAKPKKLVPEKKKEPETINVTKVVKKNKFINTAKDFFDRINVNEDGEKIKDAVINNMINHPNTPSLMKVILKRLKTFMGNTHVNFKFYSTTEEFNKACEAMGTPASHGNGFYDLKGTIHINLGHYYSDTIPYQELVTTLSHELIHAVTQPMIDAYYTNKPVTKVQRQAIKTLEHLIQYMERYYAGMKKGDSVYLWNRLHHMFQSMHTPHGMRDAVNELVAIALSEDTFTAELRQQEQDLLDAGKDIKDGKQILNSFIKQRNQLMKILSKAKQQILRLLGFGSDNGPIKPSKYMDLLEATLADVLTEASEYNTKPIEDAGQGVLFAPAYDDAMPNQKLERDMQTTLAKWKQSSMLSSIYTGKEDRYMNAQDWAEDTSDMLGLTPEQEHRLTILSSLGAVDFRNSIQEELRQAREAFNKLYEAKGKEMSLPLKEVFFNKDGISEQEQTLFLLGLSQVSPEMQKLMSDMPKAKKAKGIDASVNSLATKILNKSASMITGYKGENTDNLLKQVLGNLLDAAKKDERSTNDLINESIQQDLAGEELRTDYTPSALDKADRYFKKHIQSLSTKWVKKVDESYANSPNILKYALKVALNNVAGSSVNEKLVEQNLNAVYAFLPNALTGLADIFRAVTRVPAAYQVFAQMRNQFKKGEADRQALKVQTAQFLRGNFKVMNEQLDKALFTLISKVDLPNQIASFPVEAMLTLFEDEAERKDTIKEFEAELKELVGSKAESLIKATHLLADKTLGLDNTSVYPNTVTLTKAMLQNDSEIVQTYVSALHSLYVMSGRTEEIQEAREAYKEIIANGDKNALITFLKEALAVKKEMYGKDASRLSIYNEKQGYWTQENQIKHSLKLLINPTKEQLKYFTSLGFKQLTNKELADADIDVSSDKVEIIYMKAPYTEKASFNSGLVRNINQTSNGIDIDTSMRLDSDVSIIGDVDLNNINVLKAIKATGHVVTGIYTTDSKGNLIMTGYSVEPNQKLVDKYLAPQKVGTTSVATSLGRVYEEQASLAQNEQLVDTLYQKFGNKSLDGTPTRAWINPFTSKDPVVQDAMKLLPKNVVDMFVAKFGTTLDSEGQVVPRVLIPVSLVPHIFGERNFSLRELADPNKVYPIVYKVASSMLGRTILPWLIWSEEAIKKLVKFGKEQIVIISGFVSLTNIVSNVVQLLMNGVNPLTMIRRTPVIVKEIERYFEIENKIREIELKKRLFNETDRQSVATTAYLDKQKAKYQTELEGMSIHKLVKAGELSAIEDLNLIDTDNGLLFTGKWKQYIDKKIDKLPEGLVKAGKYAVITKDTSLFRGLTKMAQYGDFVSKVILFEKLVDEYTYDAIEHNKNMNKSGSIGSEITKEAIEARALQVIRDEFVNYNEPKGRFRGYLEDVGMLWFGDYMLKIMRTSRRLMMDNPFRFMLFMAACHALPVAPDDPVSGSVLGKLIKGTLGYSIGPDRLTSAFTMNPWANLVF